MHCRVAWRRVLPVNAVRRIVVHDVVGHHEAVVRVTGIISEENVPILEDSIVVERQVVHVSYQKPSAVFVVRAVTTLDVVEEIVIDAYVVAAHRWLTVIVEAKARMLIP